MLLFLLYTLHNCNKLNINNSRVETTKMRLLLILACFILLVDNLIGASYNNNHNNNNNRQSKWSWPKNAKNTLYIHVYIIYIYIEHLRQYCFFWNFFGIYRSYTLRSHTFMLQHSILLNYLKANYLDGKFDGGSNSSWLFLYSFIKVLHERFK